MSSLAGEPLWVAVTFWLVAAIGTALVSAVIAAWPKGSDEESEREICERWRREGFGHCNDCSDKWCPCWDREQERRCLSLKLSDASHHPLPLLPRVPQ